ncbi:MAG TPA: hypothetical protein VLB83_04905 [Candidatus Paceibacterota bacterium]|nr:hypothetical protein [Candidatus Paceibacterota bacterium]
MQEHTIELAISRVADAVEVMFEDLRERLHIDENDVIVVPQPIMMKWLCILGHLPEVSVKEEPGMPEVWGDPERYAFICRIVEVLRLTNFASLNLPATRARQFVNALGTLAMSQESAIVHSRDLILSVCVHKPR